MSGARVGVVVVAAGSGHRLGASAPKALVALHGRSLLSHALAGLAAADLPPAVVVHTPGQQAAFAAASGGLPVTALVPGGATRTDSVTAGVAALDGSVDVVVVHDAARPLTPPQVIHAAVAAVPVGSDVLAAAPGVPVADTLKRTAPSAGDPPELEVLETVDRTGLVGIQTPQVFPHAVLETALASVAGDREVTDELALVEALRAGGALRGRIVVVSGSVWSRKVTYPADLHLLELLAAHADPGALDPTATEVVAAQRGAAPGGADGPDQGGSGLGGGA